MKFDVVVGNPPYNNDIYIPFVELGHSLSSICSVFITPAKWQAKGGKDNERFRQNIVPYMKEIVYYPDAFEIFNIREQEGITYYIMDKNIHDSKNIKCICSANMAFNSNIENRNNVLQTLFHNKIDNIINKCSSNKYMNTSIGVKQSEYVSNTEHGDSVGSIEVYAGDKLSGYINKDELRTDKGLDKYKVTMSVMPVDVGFGKDGKLFGLSRTYTIKPNAVPKGSFPVLMKFDTLEEAESFRSYCNTMLIRFLYYIGICGKTVSEEFWRFVPDPGTFDHIFTDEELYKKYNLTPEEINIIESVIKERK
jgi:site-specific DNA-methyltransferase (adenine-specific)